MSSWITSRGFADSASGTASITVAAGENQIIVVPAADAHVTPAQVEGARSLIERADAVLVQMEIPLDTVEATVRLGHRLGVPVILNPAPAQQLPTDWLQLARYVTPNQHELAILLGADFREDFRALMQRSPCPVVLTRGDGAAPGIASRPNRSTRPASPSRWSTAPAPAIPSTPRSPCSCTKACRTPCARPAPPPRCR
ncbi:Ribokinase [Rhodanobacter lindaniclasticus]